MARYRLDHYKPSSRAWIAVCVLGLCLAAIVLFIVSSRVNLRVGGAWNLQLDINPVVYVPTKKGGMSL